MKAGKSPGDNAPGTELYPKYKWVVVGLCFVIGTLNYADRAAISSVFPLVQSDLHLTNLGLAAIGSFFLWSYAIASPLAGLLADRFSRSRILLWSLVGWSVATGATGLVGTMHGLLWTRVALGLFEAAYVPAAVALIADYHSSETRATAIGLHSAGLALGIVVGGAGFGYLGEHYGWRTGFLIMGFAGLFLTIAAGIFLRDFKGLTSAPPPRETRRASFLSNLASLIRIPSYLIMIVASMTIGIGNWVFLNWLPLYFKETFGMSLAGAGFAGTFTLQGAGIVAGIVGSLFSDRIAGRLPGRRMLIQLISCTIAAPFLIAFFSSQPALASLNLCIFFFSFFLAFGACNVTPLMCDLLAPRLRSTAIGIANAANCLAGGIGVMIAGLLKAKLGLGTVFGGISGLTLLASGMLLVAYLFFLKRDLAQSANPPRA